MSNKDCGEQEKEINAKKHLRQLNFKHLSIVKKVFLENVEFNGATH